MTLGAIKILRIEIDSHFHGSSDVPRPWVARIDGIDRKYGLARTFVERLNDYREASRTSRGRLRGLVAAFPLRAGHLYEVSRLRGSSSKRYVAREFLRVENGKLLALDPSDALALVDGHACTVEHRVLDYTEVAVVHGLGAPEPLGFVLVGGQRLYRLREGAIHEIADLAQRRLVHVVDGQLHNVTQREALAVLANTQESI